MLPSHLIFDGDFFIKVLPSHLIFAINILTALLLYTILLKLSTISLKKLKVNFCILSQKKIEIEKVSVYSYKNTLLIIYNTVIFTRKATAFPY